MSAEHFQPELLVEHACELAGSDDFGGDDSWREGLALLCDGLISEARLSDLGVEIAVSDLAAPHGQQAADHEVAQGESRGRGTEDRQAHLHRRAAAHRHHDPVRPSRAGPRASASADVGGGQPPPLASARDVRHRPAHRRSPGEHRDVRADRSRAAGVPPDGGAGRPGMCADHRRPVLQHDLLGAVPAADLLPVAVVRSRPPPGLLPITECSCSTCSPGCPAGLVHGC